MSRREGSVDLSALNESVPILHPLKKFWNSSLNKQNLQLLARHVGERDLRDVVLSGMIVNEELVSARIKVCDSPASDLPTLNNWQEEADLRIIPHVQWAVK